MHGAARIGPPRCDVGERLEAPTDRTRRGRSQDATRSCRFLDKRGCAASSCRSSTPTPPPPTLIAGSRAFAAKESAAALVRESGLPLGVNAVLHRHNLDAVDGLVELALRWGADRIELANTQFYGWGLLNREALMPERDQLARAVEAVNTWRERRAWEESRAFNLYRGSEWMPSPCRTCERRDQDFGGCRCQAFALTGDATRTDPACALSPDHATLTALTRPATSGVSELVPRRPTVGPRAGARS